MVFYVTAFGTTHHLRVQRRTDATTTVTHVHRRVKRLWECGWCGEGHWRAISTRSLLKQIISGVTSVGHVPPMPPPHTRTPTPPLGPYGSVISTDNPVYPSLDIPRNMLQFSIQFSVQFSVMYLCRNILLKL